MPEIQTLGLSARHAGARIILLRGIQKCSACGVHHMAHRVHWILWLSGSRIGLGRCQPSLGGMRHRVFEWPSRPCHCPETAVPLFEADIQQLMLGIVQRREMENGRDRFQ
jgi:hypothetical protein